MVLQSKEGLSNTLYSTFFAGYGIDQIRASARDFGHAVVSQFGRVGVDFTRFVDEMAISARRCVLLGLGGVARKGVDGPGDGAASLPEEPGFCVKKSVISCYLSQCGTEGRLTPKRLRRNRHKDRWLQWMCGVSHLIPQ